MRSTFYGFEIARSAIQAGQTGLDVTGQNIANTNTEGYSRQAVDQHAVTFSNSSYKYAQLSSSRVGQGVSSGDIIQIRDQFLDVRYRKTNSEYNTLSTSLSILNDVENVFDETQNDGLNAMLGDFYTQLENLSSNAGDVEFATIFRASAQKVAKTLNQYEDQLNDIRNQELYDLNIIVDDVNTLTSKINDINNTIKNEKLQGNPSNELLDERNLYLNKLSDYLDINIENNPDGSVSIMSSDKYLLNAKTGYKATLSLDSSTNPIKILNGADIVDISEGQVKGYLQSLNGVGNYAAAGEDNYAGIQYYRQALDDFSKAFADTFNTLNGDLLGVNKPLFEGIDAGSIKVSAQWTIDANYITTTNEIPAVVGKNDNIVRMINAMDSSKIISPLFEGTFEAFATSLMNDVAINVNYISSLEKSSDLIMTSIQNQRESVMGVSLNEETTNLMKYQKAFEAASRLMTIFDEALDVIINKMGLVGR